MIQFQEFLQSEYPGFASFIDTIIKPIFGDGFAPVEQIDDLIDCFENDPEELEYYDLIANSQDNAVKKLAEESGLERILKLGTIHVKGDPRPIHVYDITVSNRRQLSRNRKGIQQLITRILNNQSGAFMLFHYNDEKWEWRFSYKFVGKDKEDSTSSKRYTYLLGRGQSCKTAALRFQALYKKGGKIAIEDITDAFAVEALSKEFFGKYKAQYEKFCQFVYDHKTEREWFGDEFMTWEDKHVRDYVKKLLGRIVFLHFLQKKGWLGATDADWTNGPQDFMSLLFDKASEEQKDNFLDDILEPLFSCLDTPLDERNDVFDTKVEGLRSVRVPFLGGLFERDEQDKADSVFPKELFEGLFEFLGEYNFTIDENDPDDAEVGVDPEMLGRIFENLLEDNKDKGAFYTPKEIVQYMCRESLIAYLQTDVTDEATREALRQFVTSHDVSVLGGRDSALALNVSQCLKDVKICDPAIGSGAFPMGLLNELFLCRGVIEDFSNAADIKRHIIQENIYGVDIEKGAVEIARLRFWLSLITDADKPDALPNLDFKIMQGNSLLEQYKGFDLSRIMNSNNKAVGNIQMTLFEDSVDVLRRQLISLRKAYYEAKKSSEKQALRTHMRDIVQQQIDVQGYNIDLTQHDIAATAEFFLWHTWFADVLTDKKDAKGKTIKGSGGFDIVIGNPPYIQLQSMLEMSAVYKDAKFETYNKTGDIYCLFVEQGFNLLRKNGILTYIIPNKWMQAGYGQQLREYLAKRRILNIVDFGDVQLFENATTYTCIPLLQQAKPCKTFIASYMKSADISTIPEYSSTFDTKDFGKDAWVLSSSGELKLINKLKKKYPTLKVYSKGEAYRGVLSGLSEAFLVGTDVYNGLIDNNAAAQNKIVPFLLGRDIKPYASPTPNKYMILFEKGFTKQQYGENFSEDAAWDYIKEDYPSIANWLEPFTEKGRKRGDKGDYWWELRACDYYDEFAKPKIMYQAFQVKPNFIYDDTGCYCNNSMWILPTDNKALLGLLNSKMGWWLISKFCSQIQNGYQLIWKYFGQIPIALEEKKQQPIISLVDRILSAKKANPQADTTAEEHEIDRLVYALYGLTEEEIAIVEGTK